MGTKPTLQLDTRVPTRHTSCVTLGPMLELPQSGSAIRTLNTKVRLAELADRQWGVVSRRQLEDIGVAKAEVVRWLGERRLHRVYPGVYSVGHASLALEGKLAAALFYAAPGAGLFGLSAAFWFGFLTSEPEEVHVWTPRRKRSLPGVQVHGERKLERFRHKGLPTTPPAQTLLDIANCEDIGFNQLRKALSEAEYLKLVTLEEVEAVLGRGKPGSARLRVALECHRPQLAKTKSKLEEKFILLCERHSLTPPDVNVRISGYEVDAVWFERKIVVELDSQLAHGTAARLENDHRRDLALRAAGYTVLRYTWGQLRDTPELVVTDLRGALRL